MQPLHAGALAPLLLALSTPSLAAPQNTPTRVRVTIENLAPGQATFQTPFWVGFHDGNFDLYDRGAAASPALERLAEDGNTAPLSMLFMGSGAGQVQGTVLGPAGPLAPGERATASFLLDPAAASSRYFSYASMVIPSNDAFVANGNPLSHPVFDTAGRFTGPSFFVSGDEVLDAGTEVNDELPANTAFLGQMAPNTGLTENGTVELHPGFLPAGSGGILDQFRFNMGDFVQPGYPIAKVSLRAAPAIVDARRYTAVLNGAQEVPPVQTAASGRAVVELFLGGERLFVALGSFSELRNVVAAHLHLGPAGTNGPVVLSLLGPLDAGGGTFRGRFNGEFTADDLVGPLAGFPLDALTGAIEAGQVYVNVHTDDGMAPPNSGPGDFASGEIRGQL